MEDALRRRLSTPDQLGDRFQTYACPGKPGSKVLRALVSERVGGQVPTGSDFELRVVRLAARAGLPEPRRQFGVQLDATRVNLDLAWPDRLFAVECDGIYHHGTSLRLRWDDDRQNELLLLGWFPLRLTWRKVINEPDAVIALLRRAWTDCAARPPTGVDPSRYPT